MKRGYNTLWFTMHPSADQGVGYVYQYIFDGDTMITINVLMVL